MGQITSTFSAVDDRKYSVWRHDRVMAPNLKFVGNFQGKDKAYEGLMEYIIENDAARIIEGLVDACVLTSEDTFEIRPEIAEHYTLDELNLFDADIDEGEDAIYARKIWDMLKPEHKQLFYQAFVGDDGKEAEYELFYSLKNIDDESSKVDKEAPTMSLDEFEKSRKSKTEDKPVDEVPDEAVSADSQSYLGYIYSFLPFTSTTEETVDPLEEVADENVVDDTPKECPVEEDCL